MVFDAGWSCMPRLKLFPCVQYNVLRECHKLVLMWIYSHKNKISNAIIKIMSPSSKLFVVATLHRDIALLPSLRSKQLRYFTGNHEFRTLFMFLSELSGKNLRMWRVSNSFLILWHNQFDLYIEKGNLSGQLYTASELIRKPVWWTSAPMWNVTGSSPVAVVPILKNCMCSSLGWCCFTHSTESSTEHPSEGDVKDPIVA